ncbi:MAG: hypothetical protein WDA24_11275 [Tissierellales bacterium]
MLNVIQVGMNTADIAGSLRLYSEVFGFRNAGSQALWGEAIKIQNLGNDARTLIWWMVGAQPLFQLEFFHHSIPAQRPLHADWQPCDHGWVRLGIVVASLEASLTALARNGITPLGEVITDSKGKRVAFRDPFVGNIVEIIEETASPGDSIDTLYPRLLYATSSVASLDEALVFYRDIVGLSPTSDNSLHQPSHEALWGLAGAEAESLIIPVGSVYLEVVEYTSPLGRPRPTDYRTSDQGIVNVALGSREVEEVAAVIERLHGAGYTRNHVLREEGVIATYATDPGRELELVAFPSSFDAYLGFLPGAPFMAER